MEVVGLYCISSIYVRLKMAVCGRERERGRESRSFKSLCITVIFLEVFPCGVVYTVKINVLHKVLKFRMIILNKKKKTDSCLIQ